MFKKYWPIIILCALAIAVRAYLITIPVVYWWDPSMYIGSGKYLFSLGTVGFWETLRPPLWPIILGFTWFIGLTPLVAGKVLLVASSIALALGIYKTGEKEESGLGLASALILLASPIFTSLVKYPTNDIPSALLAFCAGMLLLKKRYAWSGTVVGLAFLMRFPNALLVVAFGLFILIESWNKQAVLASVQSSFKKIWRMSTGFILILFPYLVVNTILFKNPILPIILGKQIINGDPVQSSFFYFQYLFLDNPLIFLAAIGVVAYAVFVIKNKQIPASLTTLSILSVLVVGGYFTYEGHKELRYSFAFLPYLVAIAGYGAAVVWKKFPAHGKFVVIGLMFVIGTSNLVVKLTNEQYAEITPERLSYYSFLPKDVTAVTSSPQLMTESDARVVGIFQSGIFGLKIMNEFKPAFQYVAIDSCQVYCASGNCQVPEQQFMTSVLAKSEQVFSVQDNDCTLSIFKIRDLGFR